MSALEWYLLLVLLARQSVQASANLKTVCGRDSILCREKSKYTCSNIPHSCKQPHRPLLGRHGSCKCCIAVLMYVGASACAFKASEVTIFLCKKAFKGDKRFCMIESPSKFIAEDSWALADFWLCVSRLPPSRLTCLSAELAVLYDKVMSHSNRVSVHVILPTAYTYCIYRNRSPDTDPQHQETLSKIERSQWRGRRAVCA